MSLHCLQFHLYPLDALHYREIRVWLRIMRWCFNPTGDYLTVVSQHRAYTVTLSLSWILDQVRLKSACSATETSLRVDVFHLHVTNIGTILSRQLTTKTLIRQLGLGRLIRAFVVCICHKTGFLVTWLICMSKIKVHCIVPYLHISSAGVIITLHIASRNLTLPARTELLNF